MMPQIPLDELFAPPTVRLVAMNSSGTAIAAVRGRDEERALFVQPLPSGPIREIMRLSEFSVRALHWVCGDNRILLLVDAGGTENTRVLSVPTTGGEPVLHTPAGSVRATIVGSSVHRRGVVLVGMNQREPGLMDVHLLDLEKNTCTLNTVNEIGAASWVADHELNVRVATVRGGEEGDRLLHRSAGCSDWTDVYRIPPEDSLTTCALGFLEDGDSLLLVTTKNSEAMELRVLNVRSGEETTIYADPPWDVNMVGLMPAHGLLVAAGSMRERARWQAIDKRARLPLSVAAASIGGDIADLSCDRLAQKWVVGINGDTEPTRYYYVAGDSRQPELLFSSRPGLEAHKFCVTRSIRFSARDGLELHGYLTTPAVDEEARLATVLLVHGGPDARDWWRFDPEVQWLANRGYACLQVNYRGSSGYGKAFQGAGAGEWGRKMQDDLADAVQWVVSEGIADPKRVGIMGGSYGGYAALMGLVRHPELFACGIDVCGPSNLLSFLASIPPYWATLREQLHRKIGHPERDATELRRRSPLFNVQRIQAPLLIAQGANDPRVKREESLQMVHALREAGKEVEFLEFEGEGHGLERLESRLRFFGAAERFLNKHLRCGGSDGLN